MHGWSSTLAGTYGLIMAPSLAKMEKELFLKNLGDTTERERFGKNIIIIYTHDRHCKI